MNCIWSSNYDGSRNEAKFVVWQMTYEFCFAGKMYICHVRWWAGLSILPIQLNFQAGYPNRLKVMHRAVGVNYSTDKIFWAGREVICHGYKVICHGYKVICHGYKVICHGYKVFRHGHKVFRRGHKVICDK
jgi:hypothetical protein